jgi:hypothetical protein
MMADEGGVAGCVPKGASAGEKRGMRYLAFSGLLVALFASSDAFILPGSANASPLLSSSARSWHGAATSSARPAAAASAMKMEMKVADGKHDDAFSRRGALAALAGAVLSPALKPAFADDAGEEVVVQGEMRFEEGTDKKMAKIGGKGTCVVTLRCVGKGIISETKFDVDASQFPKPGKPPKGQEVGGGVPFVVKVKDLRAKTEKGRYVCKARCHGVRVRQQGCRTCSYWCSIIIPFSLLLTASPSSQGQRSTPGSHKFRLTFAMIKFTRTVDRDLWGDDDIFVRVDIRDGASDKKIGETPSLACSETILRVVSFCLI